MTTLLESVNKARDYITSQTDCIPEIGIVLGTGLGGLAREIETEAVIPYSDIPGFVSSTVEFHEGRLILGTLSEHSIVAMQGRFHYYEGYSMQEITFPVRVMNALGASVLIISNAAGGINPEFDKGNLVLIKDHINLLGDNPLIGVNEPELGPRFVDMSEPYSRRLKKLASLVSEEFDIRLAEGVYAAMPGPSLETAAEYRLLRIIGADMVGMSTVPENIVALQAGMEVLGLTIISDMCIPESLEPVDIKDIIATCEAAEPKLTTLIRELIRKL